MPVQLNLEDGEALKADGLSTIEAHELRFVSLVREQAIRISHAVEYVSSDDLRMWAERVGLSPKSPNAWGAVLRGPGWHVVGRKKSMIPGNHGREIKIFRWEAL